MEFIVFLLVIGVCYCLFEVNRLKKEKSEPKNSEKTEKDKILNYKKLTELKGKQCEIVYKNKMVTQTFKLSITGIIEQFDNEWVLISNSKNKGEVGNCIRIDLIQDVQEVIQ